jgi:solute carrier family 25 (mitochondrial folate transporter), member 32
VICGLWSVVCGLWSVSLLSLSLSLSLELSLLSLSPLSCTTKCKLYTLTRHDTLSPSLTGTTGKNAYRGLFHATKTIFQSRGIVGFYQGLTPNLIGSGVSWGVYFYTYNAGKRFFTSQLENPDSDRLSPVHHMMSAAMAGGLTCCVTNPIWMVKTRMQLQSFSPGEAPVYRNVPHAFARIIREEGFLSLYRGIGPALTLVSNGALQFMAYEEMRRLLIKHVVQDESGLNTIHFLAMGAASKCFSATSTYPLQVVRARLYQRASNPSENAAAAATDSSSGKKMRTNAKYNGALDVVRRVWRQEGWRGFYRGLVPQLLKTAPASALTLMAYEQVVRLLNANFDG